MAKGTKSLHHSISVDDSENMYFKVSTNEPDDGIVADGEVVFFINPVGPVLMVKMRNGPSVLSGEVATLA